MGATTDERKGHAVNGRTQVTERRQPRPAEARPAGGRPTGPHPAGARPASVRTAGARTADGRTAAPRPATAPPVPRRGAPRPGGYPSASPRTARPLPGQRTAPESRTRFVFLIVGLLGGGLLCLLMINTVLAAGAFRITALQQGNVPLAQRVQAFQAQLAAEESPYALAQRAAALGMVVQPRLHFLNLGKGRLQSQPSNMPGIPTVPGYTP
jgi:hypothetical protein